MDHRAAEPLLHDLPILVQFEDGAERVPVLVGAEGAEVIGQHLGQHRNGPVDEVHTRGALHGFFLNPATGPHIVGHVRDVHPHFEVTAVEVPHAQGVVEILGVFGVDGERGHVPHVAAALDLFGVEFLGNGLRLGFHILREMVGQAELQQDRVHFRLVNPWRAEHFDHLGDGRVIGRGPILEPDGDLDVRRGIVQEAGGNQKVAVQALVGGNAEGVILDGLQHDHVEFPGPLHHPGDVRHFATAPVHPTDLDGVPPEGGARVALGQHDVFGFAGHAHEALAILGDLNRAGDHVPVLALSAVLAALAAASVPTSALTAGFLGQHEPALADFHEHAFAGLLPHQHV